jgi:hypothetical protein
MRVKAFLTVMFCAATCFAGTTYNNFTGYDDYWHPFGNSETATYGETFTAPTNGDNNLQSFGFYMGSAYVAGDIQLSGYIATWTGTQAGSILYSSLMVDYANTGDAFLSFNTGGLNLTAGGSYIAFLSVSQYYGLSVGEAYASDGGTIPGGSFAYFNNAGNFAELTSTAWDAAGQSPDWAVDLEFNGGSVPEPASFLLLGAGLVGLAAVRRKFRA